MSVRPFEHIHMDICTCRVEQDVGNRRQRPLLTVTVSSRFPIEIIVNKPI